MIRVERKSRPERSFGSPCGPSRRPGDRNANALALGWARLQGGTCDAPPMRNVFWLRPGVIGGRTGPNYDSWDPKGLAAGGIGAVLSVNDGELVRPDELAAAGIEYCRVPFSDAAPPRPGDLEICVSALPRALSFA